MLSLQSPEIKGTSIWRLHRDYIYNTVSRGQSNY